MNDKSTSGELSPGHADSGNGPEMRRVVGDWFRALLNDLQQAPSGPRFPFLSLVLLPLLFCLGLTLWARSSGFDLGAQKLIYAAGGNSWSLGHHPFWHSLYVWGTIPSVVVVFAALAAFSVSWRWKPFRAWRRVFLFVVLTALIGPGIITNGLLKEYWGRPRPTEVVELGGRSQFEQVFSWDPSSEGLSFPCGHATMGFYFLGGFFLFRRHRRDLADGFLFTGLVLGTLMGIARMTQGGHFFTDVIWAGVICYFVPMGLSYALGLDRRLVVDASEVGTRMPLWSRIAVVTVGVAMFVAVLLGTPYEENRRYVLMKDFTGEGPLNIRLSFTAGEVEILPATEFKLTGEASGHGVPTSGINTYWGESEGEGFSSVVYEERISGWFSEVTSTTRVEIPWERVRRLTLETGDAEVRIDLGEFTEKPAIDVVSGSGGLELHSAGQPVRLIKETRDKVIGAEKLVPREKEGGFYRLEVKEAFSGTVRVVD